MTNTWAERGEAASYMINMGRGAECPFDVLCVCSVNGEMNHDEQIGSKDRSASNCWICCAALSPRSTASRWPEICAWENYISLNHSLNYLYLMTDNLCCMTRQFELVFEQTFVFYANWSLLGLGKKRLLCEKCLREILLCEKRQQHHPITFCINPIKICHRFSNSALVNGFAVLGFWTRVLFTMCAASMMEEREVWK